MHSIAFHLGPLTVHWYGVLVAFGMLVGLWTASRRARLAGIAPEAVFDIGPWLIVGGILGARILYVVSYWNESFAGQPFYEVFMIQKGGLVFYGGLIGAIAGGLIYLRLKKLPVWTMADILSPSIALGYVFGRMGCLMNGCCFGKPCEVPWGIVFPKDSPPWEHQLSSGLITANSAALPVHPTEIYDSVLNLFFYLFLAWLFRRRKFEGEVFVAYLIGYAILRSFVEYFRGDYTPVHVHGGWLTPGQLISILIILGGVALTFVLRRPAPKQG